LGPGSFGLTRAGGGGATRYTEKNCGGGIPRFGREGTEGPWTENRERDSTAAKE